MRMWRKGSIHVWLVGIEIGTAAMGNTMEIPHILKIGLPCGPAVPLPGIYPKKMKTLI